MDELERLRRRRARHGGQTKLNLPAGEKGFLLKPGPFVLYPNGLTPYISEARDFDGTNDDAERGGLVGAVDSKQGIYSFWLRSDGVNASKHIFYLRQTEGDDVGVRFDAASKLLILANDSNILLSTVNSYFSGPTWLHVLASYDAGVAGAHHLYVNNVSDKNVISFIDAIIDYTGPNTNIGSRLGAAKFNGCLSEFFFHTSYLDLSIEANRRKFSTALNKPISLGSDGSLPLGVQPLIYLPAGNPADNKGSGGNFTVNGALDVCSTSPSS